MAQEGALAPGSSSSADSLSSTDSISLDTMVVTGTRNERLLLDSPVRTEVVTRDMIERDNAHTVAEALESVPGLLLRDIHGKNGREVWLQGMSGDRVLVLVNGRPVSASTGSSIDVDQLSTFNVERIEIVKGAVSALYGNSAMGGVINVITKDDADEPGSISLDLGSYGDKSRHSNDPSVDRVRLTGGAGIHGDKTGARIDVDYIDTDGYDLDKSTYANEGAWGHRATINGRFDYEPSPSTNIAVDAGFYEESLDSGLGSFTPGIGVVRKLDTELARRESIGATLDHQLQNSGRLRSWIKSERFTDDTQVDAPATAAIEQERHARHRLHQAEIQYDLPARPSHQWTIGATVLAADILQTQKRVEGSNALDITEIGDEAERVAVDLFAQDDWFIGERWELLPGIRVQHDSDFGWHSAPKINAVFRPYPDGKWRPRWMFGLGAGYRVPNLKERYYQFDHSAFGYKVIGNPDLAPEESISVQLGVEAGGEGLPLLSANAFVNRLDNLIVTALDREASDAQNLSIFRYSNIGRARTSGLDLSLLVDVGSSIRLSGAFNFLTTKNIDTGNELTQQPRRQWQLTGIWKDPLPDSEISLSWRYESGSWIEFADDEDNTELRSPSYSTVNLRINHDLTPDARLYFGIDNLTDSHRRADSAGTDLRPEAGRLVLAGVRYLF